MGSIYDEALANLAKGTRKYEETARREDTCAGKPGAVVVGHLGRGDHQAKIWSCAFVHEGAGYLILTMLEDPSTAADDRRLHAIVEATELTRLSDLGSAEPPR